jgi:hypothetical protein
LGGGTALPALDDLTDVDTSGVGIGDTIVWDGSDWVPGTSGGGGFPWWYNVEDYGAVHDGSTDDTPAIQDAMDACMAAGGGTVFFPNGVYAIKGALQSTSTYNAQLTIAQNALTGGLTQPPISIRFLGMGPVAQSNNGASGAWLPSLSGAILLSDWNGTISGDPAVISAGKVDAEYPAASFNWVQVGFENIEIRTHANPKLSAIQMRAAVTLQCTNVTVSTDTASAGMSLPSNSNAVGIDFPYAINSNPPDQLSNVFVDGYYWGIRTSEQTNGVGSVQLSHCTKGIRFTGGMGTPTYIRHANVFQKVLAVAVPTVLVFDGDERWVTINLLAIEHESGTFAAVYDIDDASNYARGFIGWHTTDYSTGPEDNLIMNGGTGLSLFGAYAQRWHLVTLDATSGRWELAVIPGSPPDPLYAGGDFLYIFVP